MKILLTGALGYIGCETLYRFSRRPDITVYAIDNDLDAIRNRGAFFLRFPNIKILNCDITKELVIPQCDLVVHLAAKVGYSVCNDNLDETYLTNVVGTKNIVDLGLPIILFSTGSVYGEIGDVCDETVQVNPKTVYATTKYQSEQLVQSLPHAIFRPATAFGLSFKTRHDLLIHDLSRQAVSGQHIDLYQPNARRSFYSVQKLAELIEYACDNFDKFQDNIYNVGCKSGNIVKKEIVELLKKYTEFDYRIVDGEDADTRDYNVQYQKLESVWPEYDEDFSLHIPRIVEYYKAFKS